MVRALPLLALVGCFGPGKLDTDAPYPETDGGDPGGTGDGVSLDDTADTAPGTYATIELLTECGAPTAEALTCIAGDEGVTCVHSGFVAATCGTWRAEATVDTEALTVQVDYTNDLAADCPEACDWTFTYLLPPMEAGDWAVQAGATDTGSGGSSLIRTTVTVP